MRYAWIHAHRDSYSIRTMCCVLQVSSSGYYKWTHHEESPRAQRTARIHDSIRRVYEASNQIYGSYKIAHSLNQREDLESACRNTVAKAMREMGLKSKVSKRFKPTTTVSDPTKKPAPNLLDQVFVAEAPNQKWVTDITYLPIGSGWVYLAAVLDLFSRKIVGWSISESLATPVVRDALRQAVETRRPQGSELLHHSDRGCQYTSDEYQKLLKTMQITCSMSRVGCCYDNAVMERFFWSLKHEWTKFESYENIEEARLSVFQYIETFYNPRRIHQALNYKSPDEFEASSQVRLAV